MKPFVLDTDIGTDVDDILALALILGSPEVRLNAVTTVYGDVRLRAQMVARTLNVACRPLDTIVAGRSETRSGRAVWWAGHEGALMPDLVNESIDETSDPIQVLATSERVAAIAPLTNIAEAVERTGSCIREIYMMAGEFVDGTIEHNIKCDVDAADAVFCSNVPITVVGLDQTEKVRLGPSALEKFTANGPLGELLAAEMRQFWQFTHEHSNVPHDPIAILMMTSPELFRFDRGRISVTASGPTAARTSFTRDPQGPHRVVTSLDEFKAAEGVVTRILRAAQNASTNPHTQPDNPARHDPTPEGARK